MKLAQQQRTLGTGKQAAALQQVSQAARPAAAYAAQSRRALLLPWLAYNYSPKAITIDMPVEDKLKKLNNALYIRPNPAQERVVLSLKNEQARITNLQLYQLDGKLLQDIHYPSQQAENYIIMSVAHLPLGVYVVKVCDEQGNYYSDKLQIQH